MSRMRSILRSTRRHNAEAQINLAQWRAWHTANISSFSSANVDRIYWARNSSGGIPMGAAGTLAEAADSPLLRLQTVQSFGMTLQQPRRVNIEGDGGVKHSYIFEANELPSGDMVLGVLDAALLSAAQGSKAYTDGDFVGFVLQPGSPTYNQLTICTISQAKSADSGSGGQAGYMVVFWPKVEIVPLFATGLVNAQGTAFTHALVANKSSILPWGEAFTVAKHGCTEAAGYGVYSEGRIMLHTHVGDDSDDTITLTETPLADTTNKVKDWQDGTALVYTTAFANVATALTWVAAPDHGVVDVVRYEF